ncbi:MAG TPA: GGDEF domain-containing protein [Thiolinea sp.]|nr:GGDEF domain-containing protein [Thiolinea sp.]
MNRKDAATDQIYDPLDRFQPALIILGITLGHSIVALLISNNLVRETWWQFFSSILLCGILLGGMSWLFCQGKNAWPHWDQEFVHIPAINLSLIISYWLYLLPEIREGVLLTWLGLYPCLHGRITLRQCMLYSGNIIAIYLWFCAPGWADDQARFTTSFAFALSSLALCFYLGLISLQERARDRKYLAAEQRLATIQKQLKHISEHDALTGLLNRRGLSVRRHLQYESIALLVVDIDHFKLYNDHYGHLQGDNCLKQVARILLATTEELGYVSRYGGEEFVILVYDFHPHQVIHLARQCCDAIHQARIPHPGSRVADTLTISLGGWYGKRRSITLEYLWGQADKALYQAKQQGRDRFNIVFDDTPRTGTERPDPEPCPLTQELLS